MLEAIKGVIDDTTIIDRTFSRQSTRPKEKKNPASSFPFAQQIHEYDGSAEIRARHPSRTFTTVDDCLALDETSHDLLCAIKVRLNQIDDCQLLVMGNAHICQA